MEFVCPNNPKVWDGKRFTPCFSDIVLGFGGNAIFTVIVLILLFGNCGAPRNMFIRKNLHEKVFLYVVPSVGALLSLSRLTMLFSKKLDPHPHEDYVWLFICSQLFAWMVVIPISIDNNLYGVVFSPVLRFWFILKILLEIPHLQYMTSVSRTIIFVMDACSFSMEVMLGLFVNVATTLRQHHHRELSSIEDPLVPEKSEDNGVNRMGRRCMFLWELSTFKFISSTIEVGATRQLDFSNLIQVPIEIRPDFCYDRLSRSWRIEHQKYHSNSSLLRALYHAYGWTYLRLGILKVINDCVGFVGPLLLNKFIKFLQGGSGNSNGLVLALLLGCTSIAKSFLDTQYSFHLGKLKLMLRSSIMMMVYRKCLHVNLAEHSKFSLGEVQTFMSIDTDRTINLCNSCHDLWSLPLQIGVALFLLYTQVSYAFLSGLTITILLIPVNKWISTMIANATEQMMKQKDERIRSAAELLTHIRTVKIYSWEDLFTNRLVARRELEVKHLATRKYLDAWCVYFWATTPTLFSLLTFSIFTITGHSLDAATVFTCVALFNTLISPLNSFPWVINGMIDAMISSSRLSKYLSCPECKPNDVHASGKTLLEHNLVEQPAQLDISYTIMLHNACFSWHSIDEVAQTMVLDGISMQITEGLLVAVVGEVGSGKSSLVNSILGELRLICGSFSSCNSMAYVPQVPWIMSGSVRDNILFGKFYDEQRYLEVLQVCSLDIDISRMNQGDLSHIGERGTNLSGGQRARIALARAVYHDPDIYILDDVLSAVDSEVASWILRRAITGSLMQRKTRLLCTHNLQAISVADMVVFMDKGRIKWSGSPSNFLLSPYSIGSRLDGPNIWSSTSLGMQNISAGCVNSSSDDNIFEGNHALEDSTKSRTEDRREGKVELSVYKCYAAFFGWPVVLLICVAALFMQASRNGNDLWLSYWVDSNVDTERTNLYLVILLVFGAINSLFTLGRAFSFAYGGLLSAVRMHANLLQNLVNAPVQFFDENPTGRILNRVSSDLYTIDDSLPFILNILLANFFNLLGTLVVLSFAQVSFLLLIVPIWYIYSKLQFYYRATSRELRRLDSVARSPIYSSFAETLDGSSTIRAFGKEELFMANFLEHINLYQQTSYSEQASGLWLALRLQLLAALVILFISVMAVIGSSKILPVSFGTPGLAGLALSYAAPVVSLLSSFLTSFTETEKEMIAVERVLEYMDVPREELEGQQSVDPRWPKDGKIVFKDVTLRYKSTVPPALNSVSFCISAGSQVGIVGRTGAGKSSILNALLRLTPICSGLILVDGVDVTTIHVRHLRKQFAVVSQSPFLFEGSIRENLDPFGGSGDLEIWGVLEKCHIKEEIELLGGLDMKVKEGNMSFSVGQRQLICLARAILKSSKILCLDESTANVDPQTALLLQNTISDECQGTTVVTIAHRISTVLKMDNILVLDHGRLVEQGSPEVLMKDEGSRFSSFAKASSM